MEELRGPVVKFDGFEFRGIQFINTVNGNALVRYKIMVEADLRKFKVGDMFRGSCGNIFELKLALDNRAYLDMAKSMVIKPGESFPLCYQLELLDNLDNV